MLRDEVWRDWERRSATPCSMAKLSEDPAFEQMERNEILSLLPSCKKKRVLDLGAGIGRFTAEFAKEAIHVTAVEWIPNFLMENRKRTGELSSIRYVCDDATQIDFPAGSFDLVFINWLFQYLEDHAIEQCVQRIERWLSSGGIFFLRESCALLRKEPTATNPTVYRTPLEYEVFLKRFALQKQGLIECWTNKFPDSMNRFWLMQKKV